MSHLLIIELPGGRDGDIVSAALALGHRFSFATADPGHYRDQADLAPLLSRAETVLAMPADGAQWDALLCAAHRADPFDAVLCLQDLRLVEAARLARTLGLAHLSPEAAALCRDKEAVRARLAGAGMAQAPFARIAPGPDAARRLIAAVAEVGLPAIVKPVDGFGSQHVFVLRDQADLAILDDLAELVAQGPGDYGLGNAASGALLVERYVSGPVIGCDVLRAPGAQMLLAINHKIMAAPPSFTILGGCVTAHCGQFGAIDAWLSRLLDAVGFDFGMAHVEVILTADGPHLVEINPRMVGAWIARGVGAALGRRVHDDLVRLHLTGLLPDLATAPHHAAMRWLLAPHDGILDGIDWPQCDDPGLIDRVANARPGNQVRPAIDNGDRLAMVITAGADCERAVALADRIVADARVRFRQPARLQPASASCTG